MADSTSHGPRTLETPVPEDEPLFYGYEEVHQQAYSEAREVLDRLPGRAVIHWLACAYGLALPHKPDLNELIIAAGHLASHAPPDVDPTDPHPPVLPF